MNAGAPKFLDRMQRPVSHGRLQAELDNYGCDVMRGAIAPSMSFLEYVQRYVHWRVLEDAKGVRCEAGGD